MHYRKTSEILPYTEWALPTLDVPTFMISTDGEYIPGIKEIVEQIRKIDPRGGPQSN